MSDDADKPDAEEDESEDIAREINLVLDKLGEEVREVFQREGVRHQSMAMALVVMGAHHALHDGAAEEDLLHAAREAWKHAVEVHAKECDS